MALFSNLYLYTRVRRSRGKCRACRHSLVPRRMLIRLQVFETFLFRIRVSIASYHVYLILHECMLRE